MRRSSKTEQANQSPDNPSFENIERRIKKSTDSMQKYCLISLIQFISFFMINWIRSLCVSRHKWAQLQKCVSRWTFVVKWAKMIRVSFAYIFVYYHTETDKSDDYVGDQTEGMSFINDCAPNSNDIILFFMSFFLLSWSSFPGISASSSMTNNVELMIIMMMSKADQDSNSVYKISHVRRN